LKVLIESNLTIQAFGRVNMEPSLTRQ